ATMRRLPKISFYRLATLVLLALFGPLGVFAKQKTPEPKTRVPLALETFDEVWKIIYEHHFDTNFNGVNWIKAREKYRPKVAAAESTAEFRDTIQEMLDLLHVSHLAIVPGDVVEVIERPKKTKQKGSQFEEVDED